MSNAAVHDSQKLDRLVTKTNTSADVFADSAYGSAETEGAQSLRLQKPYPRGATRNHPLSKPKRKRTGRRASSGSSRAHIRSTGDLTGGRIVRTIGIVRARAKIGLQNLAYNIRRLVTLERMADA